MKLLSLSIILLCANLLFGQSNDRKFSFAAGYGFGGSFFVRSYTESNNPVTGGSYYKKRFIGSNLHFDASYNISGKDGLSFGYTRQQFSRRIKYNNGGSIFINSNIRHINNFYELIYSRRLFGKQRNVLIGGLGVFYLRPQQEEVDVGPGGILWEERNYKYNKLEEGGGLLEVRYEYSFQPRVNLGLKTQFYYTVSVGEAEAITLYPYIKIVF